MTVTLSDTLHPFVSIRFVRLFYSTVFQFFVLVRPVGFLLVTFSFHLRFFASNFSFVLVYAYKFSLTPCSLFCVVPSNYSTSFAISIVLTDQFFFVPHLGSAAHIPFSFPTVIYFSASCKICFWVSLTPYILASFPVAPLSDFRLHRQSVIRVSKVHPFYKPKKKLTAS